MRVALHAVHVAYYTSQTVGLDRSSCSPGLNSWNRFIILNVPRVVTIVSLCVTALSWIFPGVTPPEWDVSPQSEMPGTNHESQLEDRHALEDISAVCMTLIFA